MARKAKLSRAAQILKSIARNSGLTISEIMIRVKAASKEEKFFSSTALRLFKARKLRRKKNHNGVFVYIAAAPKKAAAPRKKAS